MTFSCLHYFTVEARDREEFDLLMLRYKQFIRNTSERMDMGYNYQAITGTPQRSISEPQRNA